MNKKSSLKLLEVHVNPIIIVITARRFTHDAIFSHNMAIILICCIIYTPALVQMQPWNKRTSVPHSSTVPSRRVPTPGRRSVR